MNAFFTALYNIFSAPAVVGIITACDAAIHVSGITKAIKEKIADESIESKMIVALEKALEATCDKLGWEYDSLVVRELGNFVKAQPLSVEELSDLFMMYVGPSFTPDVISVWIDNFDLVVAEDQILTNYFTTKLLRSLTGITSDISKNTNCVTNEDDKFEEIMGFSPSNRLVFEDLREAIKSGTKIMPFVGAGVSAFSYKTWKEMLRDYSHYLDDLKKEKITEYIERNELLEAAQLICDAYGKTIFFNKLRKKKICDQLEEVGVQPILYDIDRIECIEMLLHKFLMDTDNMPPYPMEEIDYKYCHQDLVGRDYQIEKLSYFLNADNRFLWTIMAGDGLTGRTKLAYGAIGERGEDDD